MKPILEGDDFKVVAGVGPRNKPAIKIDFDGGDAISMVGVVLGSTSERSKKEFSADEAEEFIEKFIDAIRQATPIKE